MSDAIRCEPDEHCPSGVAAVAGLQGVVLAFWRPFARRVITPVVTGTVLMLIAATVLPVALDRVEEVPADAPDAAGPTIALVTLAVFTLLFMRASGAWRLWSPLIGIVTGSVVAALFGAIYAGLAFLPKLTAVLTTIPSPVMGAYILTAVGLLFVEGVRTVMQDGLDAQKTMVVGVAFSLGVGLDNQTIFADLLGGTWGVLLDNGVLVGALVA